MSDEVPKEEQAGLFDSIAGWGAATLNYASDSLSSLVSYNELDVTDPNAEKGQGEAGASSELDQRRQKEFTSYKDYVGQDITCLLSVPVWIMEPVTLLQKMAEILEYTELLEKADQTEDEMERFALVVAFLVSPFSNIERPWKPFNPVLGETFEYRKGDLAFLSEQVSHHPPVSAGHGESSHFVYDIVSAPKTKFLGNSIDIYPIGRTRLKLKKSGEEYWHSPPNSKGHNLIMGRTWIDAYGDFKVHNVTTGASCHLYFTPCGWFSAGRYTFSGHITGADGVKKMAISGLWNSYCEVATCIAEGDPTGETRRLWQAHAKPEDHKYSWTQFVPKLQDCESLSFAPLPSDSRRRPDRAALEDGDGRAGELKHVVEEMQRAERREREKLADKWVPRYYKLAAEQSEYPGEVTGAECPHWVWNGEYDKVTPKAAVPAEQVKGSGFCPWQYPQLHRKL